MSDVDEHAFHLFINYLYGAPLSTTEMKTDTLVELMAVADRCVCACTSQLLAFALSVAGTTANTWRRRVKNSWYCTLKIALCFNC